MGLLQKNPAMTAVGAVIVLALAGLLIVRSHRSGQVVAPDQAYFYSLNAGDLFTAAYDAIPPVSTAGGDSGVRAYVFSCGVCNPQERFIAYLETYPADAQSKLKAAKISGDFDEAGRIMASERQIAAPLVEGETAPKWMDASSAPAQRLMNDYRTRCGDVIPVACDP